MATCTLNGYLLIGSSTGLSGAYVHAVPYDSPAVIIGTGKVVSPDKVTVLTSSSGYFELDLIQNVRFTITIPELGLRKTILVPESSGPIAVWGLTDIYTTGASPVEPEEDDW